MKKIARESWQQYIIAWKESGLSQAEFCRQAGLPYQKFCYRCQRAEISGNTKNVFVPLVPVQLAKVLTYDEVAANFGKQSGVRLCLSGVQIELERGFCLTTLSALLSLLKEQC